MAVGGVTTGVTKGKWIISIMFAGSVRLGTKRMTSLRRHIALPICSHLHVVEFKGVASVYLCSIGGR